jgi:hypothetical protein
VCLEEDQEDYEPYEYSTEKTTPLFQSDSETSFKNDQTKFEPSGSKQPEPIDYDSYARVFDQVESNYTESAKPVESQALSDYACFLKDKILKKSLHK